MAVLPSQCLADTYTRRSALYCAHALSAAFVFMAVAGGPSGSTLRVSSPIDGTDVRAGGFVASINGVRRFASARHVSRVVSNFRALGRPVRLVCILSLSSGAAYRARSSLAASSPIPPLSEAIKHTIPPPDCPVQLDSAQAVGSPLPPSVSNTVQLDDAPSLGIPAVLNAVQLDDPPSLGIPEQSAFRFFPQF